MDFNTKQRQFLLAAVRAAPPNQEFDYRAVGAGVGLSEAEADDVTGVFRRAGVFDGMRRKMKVTTQGRLIARQLEADNAKTPLPTLVETGPDRLLMAIYRTVRRDPKQEVNVWLIGQGAGFSDDEAKAVALELSDLGWIQLNMGSMVTLSIDGRREAERLEAMRMERRAEAQPQRLEAAQQGEAVMPERGGGSAGVRPRTGRRGWIAAFVVGFVIAHVNLAIVVWVFKDRIAAYFRR